MRSKRVSSLAGVGLLLGCNLVLDIQEASVDPRLLAVSDAGSTSNPGSSDDSSTASSDDSTATTGHQSPADGGWLGTTGTTRSPDSATSATAELSDTITEHDSTSSGSSDSGAAAPEKPSLCEQYCDEVMENCTGALEQYRDMRQCLTVCELYPEGDLLDDANDNTIACRLRYASNARYAGGVELTAYCRQAGPGGDGRCGTNCEGYCTLMEGVCTPEEAGIYRFDDRAECMDACQALPTSSVDYSTSNFELSDGNHVQCRIFHVTSAAMLDAEEHCEHAMGLTLCEDRSQQ